MTQDDPGNGATSVSWEGFSAIQDGNAARCDCGSTDIQIGELKGFSLLPRPWKACV